MSLAEQLDRELKEKQIAYDKKNTKCNLSDALLEKTILDIVTSDKDKKIYYIPILEGCGPKMKEILTKNKIETGLLSTVHSANSVVMHFDLEKNKYHAILL